MEIGELARSARTQVKTVRFCEREGPLPLGPRTVGNYRVYGVERGILTELASAASTPARCSQAEQLQGSQGRGARRAALQRQ